VGHRETHPSRAHDGECAVHQPTVGSDNADRNSVDCNAADSNAVDSGSVEFCHDSDRLTASRG
jgi:hypothetical protein